MKKNENLLPIGILSKLTGVHIRCLRYYEELGILHPAEIDSSSNYRYYNFYQMRIVEAIQYCVELGIPLKEFKKFCSLRNGEINYSLLLEEGSRIAREKLNSLLAKKVFLEDLQKEMFLAEKCSREGTALQDFQQRIYYCHPYSGPVSGELFHKELIRMICEMEKKDLSAGFEYGVIRRISDCLQESYICINVRNPEEQLNDIPEIIKTPEGKYRCVASERSRIAEAEIIFADEIAAKKELFLLETELFSEKFHYRSPLFEMQCYSR